MTRVGALTLNSGEDSLTSGFSDGTYGYFGTYSSPGIVAKVKLSDLHYLKAGVPVGKLFSDSTLDFPPSGATTSKFTLFTINTTNVDQSRSFGYLYDGLGAGTQYSCMAGRRHWCNRFSLGAKELQTTKARGSLFTFLGALGG